MSLHYSWGNPLNCLYTIFKVVKILTLIFCVVILGLKNVNLNNLSL